MATLDGDNCLVLILPTFGENLGTVIQRSGDGIRISGSLEEVVI